jgi:bacterial/archaeal transporter family-2 protein
MMWLAVMAVALGGVAIALQAPINGALARGIGGAVPAAAVSFGVGFVALFGVVMALGQGASFLRLGQVPPWMLLGGLLGAYYVGAVVWGGAEPGRGDVGRGAGD